MHLLNVLPLALGVSSLLIPPQIDENTSGMIMNGLIDTISLKCVGGCPVYMPASSTKSKVFWPKRSDSELGIELAMNGGKLLFNGQQLWPRPALPPTLSIKQVLRSTNLLEETGVRRGKSFPLIPVSTSIEYKQDKFINHGLMKIHPISIEIMAVGTQVVQAERVEILVTESEIGGVGIDYPVTILPYESSPLIDSCTNIWCRVRGTIALKYSQWRKAMTNKVRGWRKCGGKAGHKMGHKTGGLALKGGPNKFGPGSTLQPHAHHHRHHSRGGFFSILLRFVSFVFPPLVIGISAGMLGRAIFCMLTRAISYMIIPRVQQVFLSSQGTYIEVRQLDIEEGHDSTDGPPKYEEVYGDEAPEKEDEKK